MRCYVRDANCRRAAKISMNNFREGIKGLLAAIGFELLIWIFAPLFFLACSVFFDNFNITNGAIQAIFAAIGLAAVGGTLLIFILKWRGTQSMKEQQTQHETNEEARQPQG